MACRPELKVVPDVPVENQCKGEEGNPHCIKLYMSLLYVNTKSPKLTCNTLSFTAMSLLFDYIAVFFVVCIFCSWILKELASALGRAKYIFFYNHYFDCGPLWLCVKPRFACCKSEVSGDPHCLWMRWLYFPPAAARGQFWSTLIIRKAQKKEAMLKICTNMLKTNWNMLLYHTVL